MYARIRPVLAIAIAAAFAAPVAHAQLGDLLKKGEGAVQGGDSASGSAGAGALGGLGGLGGLAGNSLGSASTSNVTGLMTYCVKNNYLGGGDASSIKDSLMGKLGGEKKASSDSGYLSGAKGILDGGGGQKVELGGGGMKEELTKKVCDQVLSRGKSLL